MDIRFAVLYALAAFLSGFVCYVMGYRHGYRHGYEVGRKVGAMVALGRILRHAVASGEPEGSPVPASDFSEGVQIY